MRHRKKKFTLDRPSGERRALARKLALAFVRHGRLETSDAKARFLRGFIEPLITSARTGDLHARRLAAAALGNRAAAEAMLKRAAAYKDRPGGYTRMTRLPVHRAGDRSRRVLIEFV